MFIGSIKHDVTELRFFCATFADFLSWWFIDFHRQHDSSKLNSVFKIPRFGATKKVSLSS